MNKVMRTFNSSSRVYLRTLSVAMFSILVLTGGCSDNSEEKSTREVVLYCSVDQAHAEPIIAEFEKRSGIKVKVRFDTESSKTVGLVQKLRSEAGKPVADVFWSNEIFYTIRLAREGILTNYSNVEMQNWPRYLVGEGDKWHGFALRGRVIGYSTKRVSQADAPKSLEDICDPKWKGRIVMADPAFGTTGGDVASWFVHYGPDGAKKILTAMKSNEVRLVDGNSTAVRMVATGQADICMTDTDDIYAAQRNGWPIAMNYLDQNQAGSLAIPNTAALVFNAPHDKEAIKLLAFLLSAETEKMLAASESHNSPIHPELKVKFKEYEIPHPLEISYEKIADALPSAKQTARKILRK